MKLNTNIVALQTTVAMNRASNSLNKSSARLSSGTRLNSSADGGAEMAIVTKMNLKLVGVGKAYANASDATSLVQIAEGAMTEIRAMVQRIRELAVQAGNDTLTDSDRQKIQYEIDHYKTEITDTARRTEYNGINLLSGEADYFEKLVNTTAPGNIASIQKISDTVEPGTYKFTVSGTGVTLGGGFSSTAQASINADQLIITDGNGQKMIFEFMTNGRDGAYELTIEEKGLIFQVGASKGMETRIRIPKVSTATLELTDLSVLNWQSADAAIASCDDALSDLTRISARLGAYLNRFSHTQTNLDTTEFNLAESMSRLNDTDMAREMIEYTRAQVLSQTDISMLAQANQRPQQLLQLLQR